MSNIINIRINDHTGDVRRAVNEKKGLALSLMGEVVEGYAKDDCPVDTGLLRNSLTHGPGRGAPKITSYRADNPKPGRPSSGSYPGSLDGDVDCEYVGSNVEYAQYVEFGDRSHRVGKAHFLRDAGQNHTDELRDTAQAAFSSI